MVVLDDMGDKFNRDIVYYFTEGRYKIIQMIVMCHKPAHIDNMGRMNCETLYLTTYNGSDLFKNFNDIFKHDFKFDDIIDSLKNNHKDVANAMAHKLLYGMIKLNKKEKTFIIIDRNRILLYDSTVGFLDLKALS